MEGAGSSEIGWHVCMGPAGQQLCCSFSSVVRFFSSAAALTKVPQNIPIWAEGEGRKPAAPLSLNIYYSLVQFYIK
jgi:hypothetical protein